MENHIDNTFTNIILTCSLLALKGLAILAPNPTSEDVINCLQIVSLSLLVIINFKKAWYTIFKPKKTEDEN